MEKRLIKFVISVVSLLIVSYMLPGFKVTSLTSALVTAVVLGIINMFIKPIITILTIPVTILTLGLSLFFINVCLLYLASLVIPGFVISSFSTAILASILLTLVNWFFEKLIS